MTFDFYNSKFIDYIRQVFSYSMRKIIVLFILTSQISFSQEVATIKYKGSDISIEHLLQKYVQFPSISGSEKEAGDFIKSVCKENGLHISDFGNENGNYNFAASVFPLESNKPTIIFLNHIDVVPELESEKPYSGNIKDGVIYGRGTYDNKGVALMQLFSIIEYLNSEKHKESKYNVAFLAVSCEETQCDGGVSYVIKNHLKELNPAVVIGEGPTEITALLKGDFKNPIYGISLAHKRIFWLNLELEMNTSGHGSITPNEYANKEMVKALTKLTQKKNKIIYNDLNVGVLKSLSTHKKGIEKLLLKHPRLFKPFIASQLRKQPELLSLFTNTITLTNLYTNNKVYNSIPSKVNAYLDCRLLPGTNEIRFLKLIEKRLKNDNIKITVVKAMQKTFPSSTETIYYKNLESAITNYYPTSTILPLFLPNINDLGAFRAEGIPAYATIPIKLSREEAEGIHNKNEHLSIPLLYDGAAVYYNFIKKMQGI